MYFKSLYPEIPHIPDVNFVDFLLERPEVKQWPDFPAYIDGVTGQKRGFREFVKRVEDAATALGAPVEEGGMGLRGDRGEMVGVLSENCLDYPTICFTLCKIAVPFALLPAFSTPSETTALLRLAKVTRIFVSLRLLSLARTAAKELGLADDRIYILHGRGDGRKTLTDLINDARANKIPPVATRAVNKDTLAYLVFSSGTSGLPKAVMISHRNMCYSSMQPAITSAEVARCVAPKPLDTPGGYPIAIAFLPLYHAMGLHSYVFRALLSPSTVVILPKWDVDLALSLIPKYRVSHLSFVPSIIQQLVASSKLDKADLSSIAVIGSGAAHLPRELRDKLGKYAINARDHYEGYGMSECTISALFTPYVGMFDNRFKDARYMTGILLPGMEARIIREDGSEADYNEPGQLLLRGKNVAMGYWNNEKATKETFLPDGWLVTGDRFKADENGAFYYVDRAKDTLKVSGTQVSPTEIEDTLLQHPEQLISDAAVVGVNGSRMTDEKVPRAWIVLTDAGKQRGTQAVFTALDTWVKERLSRHKWLRGGYQAVNEIPKLPTGKVLRRVLLDEYLKAQREGHVVRTKL